jgi:DNA-binding PadR family transcriptional regulator
MSLKYALLASLASNPRTGYDLSHDIGGNIGLFWQATHQQIYKELSRLLEEGLLADETVRQDDKPDKRIYQVTKKGLGDLKNWIGKETKLYPTKDEMLIKIFVGHMVDKKVIEKELNRMKVFYQNRLKKFSKIEKQYFSEQENLSFRMKCQYLTLKRGIRFTKAWLSWIDDAVEMLMT